MQVADQNSTIKIALFNEKIKDIISLDKESANEQQAKRIGSN